MLTSTKEETRELFVSYQETRDPKIRERLVELHRKFVNYLANKFAHRGEPLDDLIQVGYMALIKAIDRYDVHLGAAFTTYATPTIIGEIKRYFRDLSHPLRIPRSLQELRLAISRVTEQWNQVHGRQPFVHEIATALGTTPEQVLEAEEFGMGGNVLSYDVDPETGDEKKVTRLIDFMGKSDHGYAEVDNRMMLRKAIARLSDQQRLVVYLRYYEGLSQSECAHRLGVSQMQVSRLQRQILTRLRILLDKAQLCCA